MKIFLIFALLFSASLATVFAQSGKSKPLNLSKGVAIEGYDPVGYFLGKAVKGKSNFSAQNSGATYYFSSAENQKAFQTNPAKYTPQYGGWCAYAMGATGEKVEVDPATFKILEGKLYLFYNAYFNNTLKTWNKDEVKLKLQADRNWAKF